MCKHGVEEVIDQILEPTPVTSTALQANDPIYWSVVWPSANSLGSIECKPIPNSVKYLLC